MADRQFAEDAFLLAVDERLARLREPLHDAIERVRVTRAVAWLAVAAAAVALAAAVAVGFVLGEVRESARDRKAALCGLAHLFDESIRISGRAPQGELATIYEQWKRDIHVIDCDNNA